MKALVLSSGGVDSTTCLGMAVDKYGADQVLALSVYYGQKHDKELEAAKKAIKILGGQVERTADYQIPGTEVVHRVIFIKKIAETPKKYPRPFAKIKKNPL